MKPRLIKGEESSGDFLKRGENDIFSECQVNNGGNGYTRNRFRCQKPEICRPVKSSKAGHQVKTRGDVYDFAEVSSSVKSFLGLLRKQLSLEVAHVDPKFPYGSFVTD
ncbi:hypothetical protein CEXT_473221 [Caerostris extrusa]|uniref:Uncharacterized protein n=1 Tax=Caerostris extrusa TaxID=172846 RepID=A0AAV4RYX1_CAEEX|nr:hypothetical protein CEXT_473221 [Caerostris extrusa]